MIRRGSAMLILLCSAGAAAADPASDAKLYDDIRYYYNRGECDVARPLLVRFQAVCPQYSDANPGLCQNIDAALAQCTQQADASYTAQGSGGQEQGSSVYVARVDNPLPSASFGGY